MPQPRVLFIHDGLENGFAPPFSGPQPYRLRTVVALADSLAALEEFVPDVVVLDVNSSDGAALEMFRALRRRSLCPVLFLAARANAETALEAMKEGAFDYLTKPINSNRLGELLNRAIETARTPSPSTLLGGFGEDRIVGRSIPMQEMCKLIGLLAAREVNILIRGESGTGKELVARALYQHSPRANQSFLAINCAGLPEPLLESELFGHEAGADRQRIGKLEQCGDGTLFLDEIGDLSPAVQAKMLRVLQDQRFEKPGGNRSVQTNVRLLAATNQNLEKLVADGRFRADLYYRLKTVSLRVPPLRERENDAIELAHYFLRAGNARLGLRLTGFDTPALTAIRNHDWPGNVRELQSAIAEAMLRTRGTRIRLEYLPEPVRQTVPAPNPADDDDLKNLLTRLWQDGGDNLYARVVQAVDRVVLAEVLHQTHGNQLRASAVMGIDRKTLRQKLRGLGLLPARPLVGPRPQPNSRRPAPALANRNA